jgi:hypothetical protein
MRQKSLTVGNLDNNASLSVRGGPPARLYGSRRPPQCGRQARRLDVIGWALGFLVIALVTAVFGFGGVAGTAVSIA